MQCDHDQQCDCGLGVLYCFREKACKYTYRRLVDSENIKYDDLYRNLLRTLCADDCIGTLRALLFASHFLHYVSALLFLQLFFCLNTNPSNERTESMIFVIFPNIVANLEPALFILD